ncbi:MAG: phasin family protein [Gammaproteobacteria bacterium]
MQFDYAENWTQLSNNAYSTLKSLGDINAKTLEKLTEQQFGLASSYYDAGIKQFTLVTESKGYKDVLSGQAKLFADHNDKLLDTMRKTAEIMTESKDDYAAWFERTLENGINTAKKAAPLAVKKVA